MNKGTARRTLFWLAVATMAIATLQVWRLDANAARIFVGGDQVEIFDGSDDIVEPPSEPEEQLDERSFGERVVDGVRHLFGGDEAESGEVEIAPFDLEAPPDLMPAEEIDVEEAPEEAESAVEPEEIELTEEALDGLERQEFAGDAADGAEDIEETPPADASDDLFGDASPSDKSPPRKARSAKAETPLPPLDPNEPPIVEARAGAIVLDPQKLREIAVLGDARFRHCDTITHLAISSDGRRILSACDDGAARIWDCATGKELQRFYHGANGYVWCATFIEGGKQALSTFGNYVYRWDTSTGKEIAKYQLGDAPFRLAIAEGAQQFSAACRGGRTIVWDLQSGTRKRTLRGHSEAVYGTAIDSGESLLVTCGEDKTVRIWDLATGKQRQKLLQHTADVHTVAFAPSDARFASCAADSTVRVWSAESGECLWTATLPQKVYIVAWSPDGKHVAATCADEQIYLLDADSGQQQWAIKTPGAYHWPVVFSPDGKTLYSGGDQMIWKWDAATGKQLFPDPESGGLVGKATAMAASRDARRVYMAGLDKRIHLLDVDTGKEIAQWKTERAIKALDLSADGKRLVAADDANVHVLSANDGAVQRTIKMGGEARRVAFAGSGDVIAVLASIDSKGTLQLFDSVTGAPIATLEGHTTEIDTFTVSRDGDRIVTGASDATARVWGARSGSELSILGKPHAEDTNIAMRDPVFLTDDRSVVAVRSVNRSNDPLLRMMVWVAPKRDAEASTDPRTIQALVYKLSDDRFAVREQASRELARLAGGSQGALKQVKIDDPEVAWRLRKILMAVERGPTPVASTGRPLTLKEALSCLTVHPDGRHWIAVAGSGMARKLLIGRFTQAGPRIVREIACHHAPTMLRISEDGRRILAANGDGTVSVFE